jgi:hypothetical protein
VASQFCVLVQVREAVNGSGQAVIVSMRASATPSAFFPVGSARMIVNRVVRSTRVAAAVAFAAPITQSPSP